MRNALFIHYNTPELLDAAVSSLQRVTDCNVFVFDNSDERPYKRIRKGVSVFDNTDGQLVDFDKMLALYPNKVANRGNWGSAKHCRSVDVCFDLLSEGFVLMDSDVLVKKDITPLFDESCAWVGNIHTNTRRFGQEIIRVIPFLCYLNVPKIKEHGIRYFNPRKMWFLNDRVPDMYYDTGAWLYEETMNKGLPFRRVDLDEYILHLRHGSWKGKDGQAWLNEHKELWKY